MKAITNIAGFAAAETEESRSAYMPDVYPARATAYGVGIEQHKRDTSVSRAVRIVGVIAFGQSLLFLAIWLLICASAGAATTKPAEFTSELTASSYEPTSQRSPFSKTETSATPAGVKTDGPISVNLQLNGILYDATKPAAVVNGQVMLLNKVVTFNSPNGEVKVRAVEITRRRVVVDVSGQKVELQLGAATTSDRR